MVVQTYMPSNPEWNLLKTEIMEPNQLQFNPTAEKGKVITLDAFLHTVPNIISHYYY